jgi:hypothetical protein
VRFDDYLMRAVEQLSALIAAIVGKLRAGSLEEAEQGLSQAYDTLLAGDRVFLDMVDARTLSNLLGSQEKTRLLAKLSLIEAKLSERQGDLARSEQLTARARELAAIARGAGTEDEDDTLSLDLD